MLYNGPIDCFRKILRQEGIQGLYRGLAVPLAGTVMETACLFAANGKIKEIMGEEKGKPLGLPKVFAAGAITGSIVSNILTPVELIKCRLQVAPRPGIVPYKGPIDCIARSVREEGLGVLVRGHTATMMREIPGTACWFGAYESFLRLMTPTSEIGAPRNPLVVITAGALGGMAYWGVFYPADTVKSELQTMTTRPTTTGGQSLFAYTFRQILRTKGVAGLYAGVLPTLFRAAPANATLFLCYEGMSDILRPF